MTSVRVAFPFDLAIAALCLLAFTVGCASTPDSRIAASQEVFDAWPAEVQAKVRAGEVALGMTEEQVRMAVGEPDETSTALDENGETITWAWTRSRPGVSVGLGGFGLGGSTGLGGGVGVGSGSRRELERVIDFRDGKVVSARRFD